MQTDKGIYNTWNAFFLQPEDIIIISLLFACGSQCGAFSSAFFFDSIKVIQILWNAIVEAGSKYMWSKTKLRTFFFSYAAFFRLLLKISIFVHFTLFINKFFVSSCFEISRVIFVNVFSDFAVFERVYSTKSHVSASFVLQLIRAGAIFRLRCLRLIKNYCFSVSLAVAWGGFSKVSSEQNFSIRRNETIFRSLSYSLFCCYLLDVTDNVP